MGAERQKDPETVNAEKEEKRGGKLIIEVVCDKPAHSICVFLRKKM